MMTHKELIAELNNRRDGANDNVVIWSILIAVARENKCTDPIELAFRLAIKWCDEYEKEMKRN